MALIETIDPTAINIALQNSFGSALEWQLPRSELEDRLDRAARAAAAILNAPYYEDDLTPAEKESSRVAYEQSPYSTR